MIDDLRTLFSHSWESFRTEMGRRDPEDQVTALLLAMRREMVEARAALPLLEDAARRADAEVAAERKQLEDTLRRKGMAERIGDAETVRVAEEFAARHGARLRVLEDKARVTREEREMRAAEADEMMRRYKEADANRFALLADLRRRRATATVEGALGGDHTAEIDRMKGKVRDAEAYARALDDLDADLGHAPPPPPPRSSVDERLAELKRRMGQQ